MNKGRRGRAGYVDAEIYQLSYDVKLFWKFRKFFLGKFYHLAKMSLQGTIVPDRLRSELCPWGVKSFVASDLLTKSSIISAASYQRATIHWYSWWDFIQGWSIYWKIIEFIRSLPTENYFKRMILKLAKLYHLYIF